MKAFVSMMVVLVLVTACGETSQRLQAAREPGAQTDGWHQQLRERTLNQGDVERIYH